MNRITLALALSLPAVLAHAMDSKAVHRTAKADLVIPPSPPDPSRPWPPPFRPLASSIP